MEQWPLLAPGSVALGLGSSMRQSFILSIDWSTATLLASTIASVLFEPTAMAVVRLPCDERTHRRGLTPSGLAADCLSFSLPQTPRAD